jgi:hypothetical protein
MNDIIKQKKAQSNDWTLDRGIRGFIVFKRITNIEDFSLKMNCLGNNKLLNH